MLIRNGRRSLSVLCQNVKTVWRTKIFKFSFKYSYFWFLNNWGLVSQIYVSSHIPREKISLAYKKFCWPKNMLFNVKKSISWNQRKFLWINKTFINLKKLFAGFMWTFVNLINKSLIFKKYKYSIENRNMLFLYTFQFRQRFSNDWCFIILSSANIQVY